MAVHSGTQGPGTWATHSANNKSGESMGASPRWSVSMIPSWNQAPEERDDKIHLKKHPSDEGWRRERKRGERETLLMRLTQKSLQHRPAVCVCVCSFPAFFLLLLRLLPPSPLASSVYTLTLQCFSSLLSFFFFFPLTFHTSSVVVSPLLDFFLPANLCLLNRIAPLGGRGFSLLLSFPASDLLNVC